MGWFAAAAFSLLCLLSGSLWLLPAEEGSPEDELLRLALSGLVIFLGIAVVFAVKRKKLGWVTRQDWKLALSGVGALSAPTLLLWFGRQTLSSVMAVATQASVPVVVAIATVPLSEGSDLQKRLMPSLVALTGALLLLPVALPGSSRGWAGFACYVAAAVCSGLFGILCHEEMARVSIARALLTVAGANVFCLAAFACAWLFATMHWRDALSSISLPGLLPVLTQSVSLIGILVLLRMLPPLALASRLIFIPLIVTMEASFLMHLTLSARACLGIFLMLLGGAVCLRTDLEQGFSTTMSLQ